MPWIKRTLSWFWTTYVVETETPEQQEARALQEYIRVGERYGITVPSNASQQEISRALCEIMDAYDRSQGREPRAQSYL